MVLSGTSLPLLTRPCICKDHKEAWGQQRYTTELSTQAAAHVHCKQWRFRVARLPPWRFALRLHGPTCFPTALPALISSRIRSPVAMCAMPSCLDTREA